MKKPLFLFLGALFLWQALGTVVTVNITVGNKKQAQAAGETLTLDAPVSITSANYLTAQKLVDTASSSYFIDPAATGTSLMLAGGVIFSDGTSQTTAASAIPSGTVIFYNGAACPTGWTEYTAARGRVVVGTPLSGTNAGTVLTALTDLQSPTHTHTYGTIAHTHTMTAHRGLLSDSGKVATGDPVNTASTVTTNSAGSDTSPTGATAGHLPYIQLLVCQKS